MAKSGIKRVLAGLLSVMTLMSSLPMSASAEITVVNTGYDASDNKSMILDLMDYLGTVTEELYLPKIMISEGDSVVIDGEQVATTVVPIDKELVESQNKIRSEYWLDVLYADNYEQLVSDGELLKAYFDSAMPAYRNNITALTNLCVSLRDKCISAGITKEYFNTLAENIDNSTQQINDSVTNYGDVQKAVWGFLNGNGVTLNTYYSLLPEDVFTETTEGQKEGAVDALNMRYGTLYLEYLRLAEIVNNIIGDETVDSATFVSEKLETVDIDALLYAYAGLYTNLSRLNETYNAEALPIYILNDCTEDTYNNLQDREYLEYVIGTTYSVRSDWGHTSPYGSNYPVIAENTNYSKSKEYLTVVKTLYDTQVAMSVVYDEINTKLLAMADLLDVYSFNDLGTDKVDYEEINTLKQLTTQKKSIIDNIPADLQDAWYLLYDSYSGIDAIDNAFAVDTYKDYFDVKRQTLQGTWDLDASIYKAVKYEEVEQSDGTVSKTEMKNADGTTRYYGKQSEVTPWIDLNLFANCDEDNKYLYELIRNPIGKDYKNPVHQYTYDSSTISGLKDTLKEYGVQNADNCKVQLESLLVKVDRYALDELGSDYQNIYTQTFDATDEYQQIYIRVLDIMEQVRDAEYNLLDAELLTTFTDNLKTCGITKANNEDLYNIYVEAYKRTMTGFNKHNGYAITLQYNYTTDVNTSVDDPESGNANEELNTYGKKLLLTEIPEYGISEYYEGTSDLFMSANQLVTDVFNTDEQLAQQLAALKSNSGKLLNTSDEFSFNVTGNTANGWENYLNTIAKNKSISALSGVYEIPENVTMNVPYIVPVTGRTIDMRYFIKYIPYTGIELPLPSDSRYYATAFTDATVLTGVDGFTAVTDESAANFVGLPYGTDTSGYLTVMYAQDRGATKYSALQRLLAPITQFTTFGNTANNLNLGLQVNGISGTEIGYKDNSFAVSVSSSDLPKLVWSNGTIINSVTGEATYQAGVHLWISKDTTNDGILVADWVNPVPTALKGAVNSTQTKNNVSTSNLTSVEKPSRILNNKEIVINSGLTEGTYATWAFERKLAKSTAFSYCSKCEKVVLADAHKNFHIKTYQQVNVWKYSGANSLQLGDGKTENAYHDTPYEYKMKKYEGKDSPFISPTGKTQTYSETLRKVAANGNGTAVSNVSGTKVEIVGVTAEDCQKVFNELRYSGKLPVGTLNVSYFIQGFKTDKNLNGDKEVWAQKYQIKNGLIVPGGFFPSTPSFSATRKENILNFTKEVCDGDLQPITVWIMGRYGKTDYTTKTSYNVTDPKLQGIMIDFYYNGIPESRKYITNTILTEGTVVVGDSQVMPSGSSAYNAYNILVWPAHQSDEPLSVQTKDNYLSNHHLDSTYYGEWESDGAPVWNFTKFNINKLYKNIIHYGDRYGTYTKTDESVFTVDKADVVMSMAPVINASSWGVVASETLAAAVYTEYKLEDIYNIAQKRTLIDEKAYSAVVAYAYKDNRSVKVCRGTVALKQYVDSIMNLIPDDAVQTKTPDIGNLTSTFEATDETTANKYFTLFDNVKVASINAMIVPIGAGTQEEYTAIGASTGNPTGAQTVKVTTPKLTYVPYTIINNITGVTKPDGTAKQFVYKDETNVVIEDVFGEPLINEYRSETLNSAFKTYVIPEVLMTYKDHFMNDDGTVKEKEERGALDTVYVAGYNKYDMEMPSYNSMRLYTEIDGDSFEVAGSAEANSKGAKALSGSSGLPVYYTGSQVSVVVDEATAPEVEFRSYVLDFENEEVGKAWQQGEYNKEVSKNKAQDYVNKYIGESGSFEYDAVLSTTYGKQLTNDGTSNAENSSNKSTIVVDGVTQEPITVAESYKFDIVNGAGEKNKTEEVDSYKVEIRNGRLASVTAHGVKYPLYGNGDIVTSADLMNSSEFAILREAEPDLAEALIQMEIAEYAAKFTHNGGNQNWLSYKGTGIFADNTGKTVEEAVEDIDGVYDSNFDGSDGWYREDVTTLVIKEYSLRGEISGQYAFSYKIPMDYGYKSPRSKNDFFKSGTALYGFNELYFKFKNEDAINVGTNAGVSAGLIDVVGNEGTNRTQKEAKAGYIISNATVNDINAY